MSEEGTSESSGTEMAQYKKVAWKVVTFKYVYDKDDLDSEDTISFKPEMCHQIFGESETIFGYRSVQITLNYLHNSCKCYIDVETSGKFKGDSVNMKSDDIMELMDPWLPSNYTKSCEDFVEWVTEEDHEKMYGVVVETFKGTTKITRFPCHNVNATYKITQNGIEDPAFREFHARFETFIVWYIDAANFIDLDDSRWIIYYVYEEFTHPINQKIFRSPVGFCTVYKFYQFPDKVRTRISQFFILPSHQKRGIGTTLYETVANILRNMDEVVDITVEEPTSSFQKIRDLYDCALIHKELLSTETDFFSASPRMIFDIAKKKKICRRQCQRVHDILGLYYSSELGTIQYNKFMDSIKRRITNDQERASRPGKRFCTIERTALEMQVDKQPQIDAEYKRHFDDIEPSLKYLQRKLKNKVENGQ